MKPRSWMFIIVMLAAALRLPALGGVGRGRYGSLRVESEPDGAVVYVDGRAAGETLTVGRSLPACIASAS